VVADVVVVVVEPVVVDDGGVVDSSLAVVDVLNARNDHLYPDAVVLVLHTKLDSVRQTMIQRHYHYCMCACTDGSVLVPAGSSEHSFSL
jgi:hypothetical protein